MIGYHVTTPRKLARYQGTGAILPPVRFFATREAAAAWARKTQRPLILVITVGVAYPLPDHGPAYWTPELVRAWAEVATPPPAALGV